MPLTDEDIKKIEDLFSRGFTKAFGSIWENNLEPNFNEIYSKLGSVENRLGSVENRLGSVESKVDDLTLEVKANGRKLDSEINYRDRLETRVKTLEKSH